MYTKYITKAQCHEFCCVARPLSHTYMYMYVLIKGLVYMYLLRIISPSSE